MGKNKPKQQVTQYSSTDVKPTLRPTRKKFDTKIKCPICSQWLNFNVNRIADHFLDSHPGVTKQEFNEYLLIMFGTTTADSEGNPQGSVKKSQKTAQSGMSLDNGTAYYDEFGTLHISRHGSAGQLSTKQKHSQSNPGTPRNNKAQVKSNPDVTPIKFVRKHFFCQICKRFDLFSQNHMRKVHHVTLVDDTHVKCIACDRVVLAEEFHLHTCQPEPHSNPASPTTMPKMSIPKHSLPAKSKSIHPRSLKCNQCGYFYPEGFNHSEHYHPTLPDNVCPFCKRKFSTQKSVIRHIHSFHAVRFISRNENHVEKNPDAHLIQCCNCKQRLHPNEVVPHQRNHTWSRISQPSTRVSQPSSQKKPTQRSSPSLSSEFDNHPEIENQQDGGKYLGYISRESGRFGSLPEYDDYSDEADA